MSVEDVLARVRQLETSVIPPAPVAPATPSLTSTAGFDALVAGFDGPSQAAAQATELQAQPTVLPLLSTGTLGLAQPTAGTPSTTGAAVLARAQTQVGQGEQPPGSNDGAAIAAYRSAVAGSVPGDPWCAEFVSWAAAQAGTPLGDGGTGFRSVAALTDWAARTGRLLPAGSTPQPGDLILFGDRHVGIVESVEPNGTIDTIEGNYANAVTRVHRAPSEATGFVRL